METESARSVPCQCVGDRLCWVLDNLPEGGERTYRLSWEQNAEARQRATLRRQDGQVEVWLDEEMFTAYHHGTERPRPYLFPLHGPCGLCVTRSFPMEPGLPNESTDHVHHTSLYTAYGDVNGSDCWAEKPPHGRIVHRDFLALEAGPVLARLVAENEWQGPDGEALLTEQREILAYALQPGQVRILDFAITLRAAFGPVTLGDTKEGGILSVRVASSMEARGQGRITNAYGGINQAETWGKPAPWCDYSGPVWGRTVGIAILDHPSNLRHPTCWHVRDYGLMTANPFAQSYYTGDPSQRGDWTLPEGSSQTFRYRVYLHPGDARQSGVAEGYHNYANPPTVELSGA